MRTSNIIKKSLGDKEEVKYKFSLSNEYVRIKLSAAILKWLLIISVLSMALFVFLDFKNDNQNLNGNQYFNYQGGSQILSKEVDNNNWLIWTALIFFLFIVLPILSLYNLYYLRISNEYFFTNQRVLIKKGWLSTKTVSIHYDRITDISVTQNLLDRILKIGSISISTAGSEGYEVNLNHVSKPYLLKKKLFSLKQEQEAKSRHQLGY